MAEMNITDKQIDNQSPWLIFEVDEVLYALNCAKIQSIMKMPVPEKFVALPDAPNYIRNVVQIRDNVVPTLDLRQLYGLVSVAEEYEAFKAMIEQRKKDHINWVNTLKSTHQTGKEFTLARDPHECAFGKWFYNYECDHEVVNLMMRKIEEPHRKLHEAADRLAHCKQEHDKCTRKECLKVTLEHAEDELMPKILQLLDEVKEVFQHRYQEKLIVLEDGERRVAVIVDDVKAIDQLLPVDGHEEFSEMMQNKYVYSVGKGQKIQEIILMIKTNQLLELVQLGRKLPQIAI